MPPGAPLGWDQTNPSPLAPIPFGAYRAGPDEPVPFGPYASSWVLATSASLSLRAWDSSRVSPLLKR